MVKHLPCEYKHFFRNMDFSPFVFLNIFQVCSNILCQHFNFMHMAFGTWGMSYMAYGSSSWMIIECGFHICSSCNAQFYQCYGFPLILSSPFQHLLPNQLLGRHHIFSSTNSKFNDIKIMLQLKAFCHQSPFKISSLPFLIIRIASIVHLLHNDRDDINRGTPTAPLQRSNWHQRKRQKKCSSVQIDEQCHHNILAAV